MKLILHGGELEDDDPKKVEQINMSLKEIVRKSYDYLTSHTAVETVVYAVTLLEDDPLFNAGTGSELQVDGKIRMSAAISDGAKLNNSSVTNIEDVKNPIRVAEKLLQHTDKGLSAQQAVDFARENGFDYYSPETEEKRRKFEEKQKGTGHGTVGCVALDKDGNIAAATSTGGVGKELPGRIADTSTVAGNYANSACGVSCTGTGEDIINNALAAKIATRVLDGFTIKEAFDKSISELEADGGEAGAIGLDKNGNFYHGYTELQVSYASYDGEVLTTFMDDPESK